MPPIPSVAAVIRKGKKVLFLNLSYQNGYGLPGGIVAGGETLNEALKREVMEETGLSIKKAVFFDSYTSKYKGINTVSFVYKVIAGGKETPSKEGNLVWLEPNEAYGKFAYKDTEKTINDLLTR